MTENFKRRMADYLHLRLFDIMIAIGRTTATNAALAINARLFVYLPIASTVFINRFASQSFESRRSHEPTFSPS